MNSCDCKFSLTLNEEIACIVLIEKNLRRYEHYNVNNSSTFQCPTFPTLLCGQSHKLISLYQIELMRKLLELVRVHLR